MASNAVVHELTEEQLDRRIAIVREIITDFKHRDRVEPCEGSLQVMAQHYHALLTRKCQIQTQIIQTQSHTQSHTHTYQSQQFTFQMPQQQHKPPVNYVSPFVHALPAFCQQTPQTLATFQTDERQLADTVQRLSLNTRVDAEAMAGVPEQIDLSYSPESGIHTGGSSSPNQPTATKPTYVYDTDFMHALKDTPLCRARPDFMDSHYDQPVASFRGDGGTRWNVSQWAKEAPSKPKLASQ